MDGSEGGRFGLETVKRISLWGPVYISEESYANLAKFVSKSPPPGCHLETTIHDDGGITHSCKGPCPDGEVCAMAFDFDKEGNDFIFWCECRPLE